MVGMRRRFDGSFKARWYYVSPVGLDEKSIKKYIREQEAADAPLEQFDMLHAEARPLQGAHEQAPLRASQEYAPGLCRGAFNGSASSLSKR